MKIAVIMPVYNDEVRIKSNIKSAIHQLNYMRYDFQIVVVNDGSTDNTNKRIAQLAKEHTCVSFTSHEPNQGKGYSFIKGVDMLRYEAHKPDYILLADSDMQISLYELPAFFNIMKTYNADVVIGNKRHPYSDIHYTLARHIISNTYNFICRMLFGIQVRDTQCGFKLFKWNAICDVRDKIYTRRFAFDVELLLALREMHYRIAVAPVAMSKQYNAGSISLRNIWQTFTDTIAIWWRKKRGYYARA